MAEAKLLLRVKGMTCDGCSQTVQQALEREDGVVEAIVSWEDGLAELTYDTALTDEQHVLSNRVFKRQYRAERVYGEGGC